MDSGKINSVEMRDIIGYTGGMNSSNRLINNDIKTAIVSWSKIPMMAANEYYSKIQLDTDGDEEILRKAKEVCHHFSFPARHLKLIGVASS